MSTDAQKNQLISRLDVVVVILLSIVGLGLYVRTLVPWPLTADSGEFQVLAFQVGMAHATGYPVYILLAKVFTLVVSIRDIAYRVNLFSAVMGVLAVIEVYVGGRILSDNRYAGLFGALVLLVSYTFWSQAIIAEVYAPAAALFVGVWLGVIVWHKTGKAWALFVAGLCGSLGLGIHAQFVLAAPAVAVYLWLDGERWKKWWKPVSLGVLIGLLLLAVAYIAVDLHAPPANIWNTDYGPARAVWGMTEQDIANPVTRILFVATAREWAGSMFKNPAVQIPKNLSDYIEGLPNEFYPPVFLLILLGAVALFQQDRRLAALFGIALVVHWLFYFNYAVKDIFVFYIPGYILMAMLAAIGLAKVLRWIEKLQWRRTSLLQAGLALVIILVSVVPQIYPYRGSLREHIVPFISKRGFVVDDNTVNMYKAVKETVRQLPPRAIVFTKWGYLYLYYYVAQLEQHRDDLLFVTAQGSPRGGLAESLIELIHDNINTRPVYFTWLNPDIEKAGFTYNAVEVGPLDMYKIIE